MKHLLSQLLSGRPLSIEQASEAFESIAAGQATPAQVGALLAMIQMRGPSVEEIAGAARVMRTRAVPVPVPAGMRVIDTCGTGGDGSETFNISTAAAIVAAGAARPYNVGVAKHGNRAVTSKSGSSQVLQELGVRLEATPEVLSRCLDTAGICFCFAPAHHAATRHVVPIRQELGFRTMFNLLGPLTNPAGADRQLMGVFSPDLTQTMAQVLSLLGSQHAMVVCATLPGAEAEREKHLDELSTAGNTRVSELINGQVLTYELDPRKLGIPHADPTALRVDSPQASARVIQELLAGKPGPARDIVCLNAGAALYIAGVAETLAAGLSLANESIDGGAAKKALETLVQVSNSGGR